MSLLDAAYEPFCVLMQTRTPDGEGGFVTVRTEGTAFPAAAVLDTSTGTRIAEHDAVSSVYTVTTPRSITLYYHDIIKRVSDGKIFRVISDGTDRKTPPSAGLDMRQVTAEEWAGGACRPFPAGAGDTRTNSV